MRLFRFTRARPDYEHIRELEEELGIVERPLVNFVQIVTQHYAVTRREENAGHWDPRALAEHRRKFEQGVFFGPSA